MAKKRLSFPREFKVSAIKLITEKGYLFAEAARQLGILDNQLGSGSDSSIQTRLKRCVSQSAATTLGSELP